MEILNQFGVNPLLLAAQVVNFFLLLFILKKLLYKPILKVLEERKKRIADSIKNAEEIERKLLQANEQAEKILEKALKESQKILSDTNAQVAQIIAEANSEAEQILLKAADDAKSLIAKEREILLEQVKSGAAGLIALTYQKIMNKTPSELQKKIIEKEVKNIS